METGIAITTDRSTLNLEFIHRFISNSYWARGRTRETMKICMEHSLNFGLYADGQQIGYGRVVTDYGQFAYILDLFIDESHRGKGYSKLLMQRIMSHPDLQQVRVWRLATNDAHGLYEQFGFRNLAHPETIMELIK